MADIYGRAQNTAQRLLKRFKQGTITLTRTTPGVVDPDESWVVPTPVVRVYDLDATSKGVSSKYIDGTTILATDLMITCGATMRLISEAGVAVAPPTDVQLEPAPGDAIAIGGRSVTTLRVIRVPPSGTIVAWRFLVRG